MPSLNGLRAISILLVIMCHANMRGHFVDSNSLLSLFTDGLFGVTVFFVLSGFLITTLLLQEEEKYGRISIKQFYLRRALRILPAYYAVLSVYAILQWASVLRISPVSWITALTYTTVFYPDGWATAHFWSLSTEEIFYLAWPFIFSISRSARTTFSLLVVLYFFVLRLIHEVFPSVEMGSLAGDAIVWGCMFALWQKEILRILNRLFSQCRALILLPFLMILLLEITNHIQSNNLAFRIFQSVLGTTFGSAADFCIGLIILISIHFADNWWFAFLNLKWINQIGILSYSLYLWQQIFFTPSIGVFSVFPLNIVFIFIAAGLSYGLIERPFLLLKARVAPNREPRTARATSGGLVSVYRIRLANRLRISGFR
jgi:peptidoglycan/LPS O-acetylase OafA/YrhL